MYNYSDEELSRYSRNILLKEVGFAGQQALLEAKILIIGAGGLGSPAALYLAAAGVGTIGIADADAVDISNLQRQIIHFTEDIGIQKVDSAKDKMGRINPGVKINTYHQFVSSANINSIIKGYDFIIDGTDNFPAKFLINDACVLAGIPFSHGGILRFDGQTLTIAPWKTACYRCVFASPPPKNLVPTCSQAGILGAVAGILGTIQATEALKFILKTGTLLTDTLLVYNAKSMDFRKVGVKRNPKCPICGENPSITALFDEEQPVCDLAKR